jgi:hypothetical protein
VRADAEHRWRMNELLTSLFASEPNALSGTAILTFLTLSFVLGQLLAWVYIWTHSGLSYSRSQAQSLVLLSVIVTLVMLAVGNNLARAFGLFGALALVRFRTPIKDTRDTAFLFMSVGIGIAVGSQNVRIAVLGTLMLSLLSLYLFWTGFGGRVNHDGLLRFYLPSGGTAESTVRDLLTRYCTTHALVQTRDAGTNQEFAYRVRLGDTRRSEDFLRAMRQLAGISGLSLSIQDQDQEV